MLGAGSGLDAVGIVEQHAEVADAPDAGFRAHRRLTRLDARVAEDALLGLARFPVVVNLLVGAGADAHAPAAALVLVDQHNAVFLALVDRARGAARHTGWIQAVLAQARQVHHEGVFELAVDVVLDVVEVLVLAALGKFAAQQLFPVRTPLDLLHALARDQAARACRRQRLRFGRRLQMRVVEGEGFVVIVNLGQVRVRKDAHQQFPARALARLDLAVRFSNPAAIPFVLVLPLLGVADAGFGLDIVEPCVFHAGPAGPDVLAGDRTGVATDALVQVQNHADLCAYFHVFSLGVGGC